MKIKVFIEPKTAVIEIPETRLEGLSEEEMDKCIEDYLEQWADKNLETYWSYHK